MCTTSKTCSKCSACSVKRKTGKRSPTKKEAMRVIAKLPASKVKSLAKKLIKKK